ncbi:hypothetical protein M3J09_004884 [Ascochyta lentis]
MAMHTRPGPKHTRKARLTCRHEACHQLHAYTATPIGKGGLFRNSYLTPLRERRGYRFGYVRWLPEIEPQTVIPTVVQSK